MNQRGIIIGLFIIATIVSLIRIGGSSWLAGAVVHVSCGNPGAIW